MWETIGTGLKILFWFLTLFREMNDEKKKKKREIINGVDEAIKNSDVSSLNIWITRARGMR